MAKMRGNSSVEFSFSQVSKVEKNDEPSQYTVLSLLPCTLICCTQALNLEIILRGERYSVSYG